jgi:hypothetical protein
LCQGIGVEAGGASDASGSEAAGRHCLLGANLTHWTVDLGIVAPMTGLEQAARQLATHPGLSNFA